MGRLKRLSKLEWLIVVIIAICAGLTIRVVFIQGIGYDAAFEMEAFLTVQSIPTSASLTEAYDLAPITSEFYGLLTFQVASVLASFFGLSLDVDVFSSYLLHHLVIAVMSIAGAIAAGTGLGIALRSRTAGLFATALIMSTPLWLGMSAMNYKDMPVAAGLSLVALGLILAGSARQTRAATMVGAILLASLGALMALGTRAGALALIAALMGGVILIHVGQGLRSRDFPPPIRTISLSVAAIALSVLGLFATNPFARIDFLTWMQDSIAISRSYIWIGEIRTAGIDLPSDQLPWWYVPVWLLAQLPILTTAAITLGAGLFVAVVVRGHVGALDRQRLVQAAPVWIQGWILPLLIVAAGSVLYDGIRHLSFALPGILAMAALPLAAVRKSSKPSLGTPRRVQIATSAVAVVVIAASLFASVRWFPYTYAFINPIAGIQKEPRAWELDYWGLTSREGVARLRAEGLEPIVVAPAPETGRPFDVVDGATGNAFTTETGIPHGVYFFRRWDAVFRQDWCTRTFTIERDGQILGEGGTCP